MTIDEFKKRSSITAALDPRTASDVVRNMAQLHTADVYCKFFSDRKSRSAYSNDIEEICLRLDVAPNDPQVSTFGKLMQEVLAFPEEADIGNNDMLYSYYLDILAYLAVMHASFVKPY